MVGEKGDFNHTYTNEDSTQKNTSPLLRAALKDEYRKKYNLPVVFGISYFDKNSNRYPKHPGFKGWQKSAKGDQIGSRHRGIIQN